MTTDTHTHTLKYKDPGVPTVKAIDIVPAPLLVSFSSQDGTKAQLRVDKGTVTFEGNPDTAAELFIETMTRKHSQQWLSLQSQLKAAEARLADYEHHNGLMITSNRLAEAERARDALQEEVCRLRKGDCVHCKQ